MTEFPEWAPKELQALYRNKDKISGYAGLNDKPIDWEVLLRLMTNPAMKKAWTTLNSRGMSVTDEIEGVYTDFPWFYRLNNGQVWCRQGKFSNTPLGLFECICTAQFNLQNEVLKSPKQIHDELLEVDDLSQKLLSLLSKTKLDLSPEGKELRSSLTQNLIRLKNAAIRKSPLERESRNGLTFYARELRTYMTDNYGEPLNEVRAALTNAVLNTSHITATKIAQCGQ